MTDYKQILAEIERQKAALSASEFPDSLSVLRAIRELDEAAYRIRSLYEPEKLFDLQLGDRKRHYSVASERANSYCEPYVSRVGYLRPDGKYGSSKPPSRNRKKYIVDTNGEVKEV